MSKTPLPELYRYSHDGSPRVWKVWADGDKVHTKYGQVGGKMQHSSFRCEAKNVGKRNATTPEGQAIMEAQALWKHKLERRYFKSLAEAKSQKEIKPMKAKKFQDRIGKEVKDGKQLSVQPKLDGIRMMAYWEDDELITIARSGKSINLPHVREALEEVMGKGFIFDGELYVHGEPFQRITSWVKRQQPNSLKIKYCIYDIIPMADMEVPWERRMVYLADAQAVIQTASIPNIPLAIVPTMNVDTIEAVFSASKRFVASGYEGAMVRLPQGQYQFAHRSKNLLKVKEFQDDEFEVVDVVEGIGKFEGCGIFVCKTHKGKLFNATPRGTMEERRELFEKRIHLIGQQAKVTFFEYSNEGIPRFPIAEGTRLPEDMDG